MPHSRQGALDNRNGDAVVFALGNGKLVAVACSFWLNEGKVSAVATSEPAESASNFSALDEGKIAAAATATTLIMVNNEVLIFIADVDLFCRWCLFCKSRFLATPRADTQTPKAPGLCNLHESM